MRAKTLVILTAAALNTALILPVGSAEAKSRMGRHSFKTTSKWTMPWQLSLSSAASRRKGERTIVARLPRYGRIRGTRTALHYVFAPLPKARGRNALVNACRATVAESARKLGAVRIDAASAGPEHRTRSGLIAPVGFRLFYASLNGRENYEVRQGVLTCSADRRGKIRNAYI